MTAFKANSPIGTQVAGTVTGFNDSFAYVRLPGGAEGSIHVSKLRRESVGKPADVLTKNEQITATVIGYDDQRSKVQLSLIPASTAAAAVPRPAQVAARPPGAARPSAPSPPPHRRQPRTATAEAATVADAIELAYRQLAVPASGATYEVLEQRAAEEVPAGRATRTGSGDRRIRTPLSVPPRGRVGAAVSPTSVPTGVLAAL